MPPVIRKNHSKTLLSVAGWKQVKRLKRPIRGEGGGVSFCFLEALLFRRYHWLLLCALRPCARRHRVPAQLQTLSLSTCLFSSELANS